MFRKLILIIFFSSHAYSDVISLDCDIYFVDINPEGKTVTIRGKKGSGGYLNGDWEEVYGNLIISSTRYTWYNYNSKLGRKNWVDRNTLEKSSEDTLGRNFFDSTQCEISKVAKPKI